MKFAKPILILALTIAVLAPLASAQTVVGWGGAIANKFAQSLSDCPVSTNPGSYFTCIVVPADGSQPYQAMSVAGFQGGQPFVILSPGQNGQTPTFQIGTVTSGSTPAVNTNGSTPPNYVLNFTLPQGQPGSPGVIVGNTITFGPSSIYCEPTSKGNVQKGFNCSFNGFSVPVTGIK